MDTETLQNIQAKTEELLARLGIKAQVVVELNQSEVVKIDISPKQQGESLGVLIGFRGETLRALQLILSLMINKGRAKRLRIFVDVDGYRKQHEENLKKLTQQVIQKVRTLQEPIDMNPMSSYERRLVHLEAAQAEGVVTESTGEERERRVVIKPV